MLTGLARDGGLYVPETVPTLSHADIAAMAGKSYEEIAFQVMRPLLGIPSQMRNSRTSLPRPMQTLAILRAPMVQLDNNHFLLELFHGPTLAFKDFAMQLIGQLFQVALNRRGDRVTIVGATSMTQAAPRLRRFYV